MTGSGENVVLSGGLQEVAAAHRFDVARLERYLADHLEAFRGPLDVQQFAGGQSNPTYALASPSDRLVLRRKPPGKLLRSAHAVDREFRILSALNRIDFPVPRTRLFCDDETVIGTIFFVMDRVDGRVPWDARLPDASPKERAAIYDSLNETLARLHGVDYEGLGLGDYGRPGNYFARQISRWSRQYGASETVSVPAMDRLIEWLPEHIPAGDDLTTIVHGDMGLNNVMIHPDEPRLVAVLDWELSTLGHPLADLTYQLSQRHTPGSAFAALDDTALRAQGLPTEAEYVAAYCRRTGRDGIPDLDFYFAYHAFRTAAILQGIVGRARDGTAADARAPQFAAMVPGLAELGMTHARRLGA